MNAEEQVIRLLGPVEEGEILGDVVARPAICSDSGDALERLQNVRIERCFRFQAKPALVLHIICKVTIGITLGVEAAEMSLDKSAGGRRERRRRRAVQLRSRKQRQWPTLQMRNTQQAL